MSFFKLLRSIARDENGSAAVTLAGSMTMLVGAGAVALDIGSLYMAKRKLQGLADSAAMSITEEDFADGSGSVRELLVRDGSGNVQIVSLVPGKYVRDPALAADKRFQPGDASNANAMEVRLSQDVKLTFGALLAGKNFGGVEAKAIAMRESMAAYALTTKLTNVGGDLPNQILSAIAGTNLNLSSTDIAAMNNSQIDLFDVADAVAAQEGLTGSNYETIFDHAVSPSDFLSAVGAASDDPDVQNLVEGIAPQVDGEDIALSQIVNLGDLGRSADRNRNNPLTMDALTMTRLGLQMAHGATWEIALGVSIPGLANSTMRLAGTNATQQSPLMTVSAAKGYVLRSASNRLYLETNVAAGALGSIKLPVLVEAAKGEARMTAIACQTNENGVDGVTLGVKPSIGSAKIGAIDTSKFDDFSTSLAVSPAPLVKTALIQVSGSGTLDIGGNAEQLKLFTLEEIESHVWKSVFTSDATAALASSLVKKTSFTVSALGLGVNSGATTTLVGNSLALAAPAIDQVLLTAMQTTGVGLGVSDVTVNRVTCGMPVLVG